MAKNKKGHKNNRMGGKKPQQSKPDDIGNTNSDVPAETHDEQVPDIVADKAVVSTRDVSRDENQPVERGAGPKPSTSSLTKASSDNEDLSLSTNTDSVDSGRDSPRTPVSRPPSSTDYSVSIRVTPEPDKRQQSSSVASGYHQASTKHPRFKEVPFDVSADLLSGTIIQTDARQPSRPAAQVGKPEEPARTDNVIYPLYCRWSFWTQDPRVCWELSMNKVFTMEFAHEYWQLFNSVKEPWFTSLNYNLFKEGIKPEYEDPANHDGGRWNLLTGMSGREADAVWRELTLLVVGGAELGATMLDHVNGVMLMRKKHTNLIHASVWLDTVCPVMAKSIGVQLLAAVRRVMAPHRCAMEFVPSNSTGAKKGRHSVIVSLP